MSELPQSPSGQKSEPLPDASTDAHGRSPRSGGNDDGLSRSELLAKVAELEEKNLALEREIVRRGVKLSCANVALARAQIAFDEISQEREEVVQDIAHDLKTPLTSIRGAAQNVLEGIVGPIDKNVGEYMEIIRDQSDRLVNTVNWLVSAIRIENETHQLNPEQGCLTGEARKVVRRLQPLADEKGVSIVVEGPQVCLTMDVDKVHSIIENLVGNALKFTPSGKSVHVEVRDLTHSIALCVSDEGIGMTEDTRKSLFRRYYRGTSTEGSGLGLIIVKNLARLHHARLEVESELGKGSTFTVTFPSPCLNPE